MRYGFGGRLIEGFPSQIIVDATEVCNLACIHCPHPAFKRSTQYAARHLDVALHRKMVREVGGRPRHSAQHIRHTSNGEPLIHPKIFEMLDDAVMHAHAFISLTTNGTLLDAKRIQLLIGCNIHLVDISLDANSPETYAKVRVNGDLNKTRANVLALIKAKREVGSSMKIVVSFVQQPENMGEADAFEMFWKKEGADHVVVRRLHSAAGGVSMVADQLRHNQENVVRYPCLYPWERVLLTPGGELAFCPQDWVHGSVLADYRTTTLEELWKSPTYQALREAHLKNDFSRHKFCGQCPDWQQTRWPGEGRSYADLVSDSLDLA